MATTKQYADPREYIKFMLEHFKFERYFYAIATIISLVLLFYCVFMLLKEKDSKSLKSALTLLAPGGMIAGACYRILKIWNDCFKVVRDFLNRPQHEQG